MNFSFPQDRRALLRGVAAVALLACAPALAESASSASASSSVDPSSVDPLSVDPLPSWREGVAKQAILRLVAETADPAHKNFAAPEARIAVFDQDGTLWVEHPIYTQLRFCLDRVPAAVESHPEWREVEPFKTVLSGDRAKIAALTVEDLIKIAGATLTGMDVELFADEVAAWLKKARDPRWDRPYAELAYRPMLEVMNFLRAQQFKLFIVTGGGQDFVRVYAEQLYGAPPENIVGSAVSTQFSHDEAGRPVLIKQPKLLLNDDKAGKPEGIHLMIGRRPLIAFGNSTGDRDMLDYVTAGPGARLGLLVLHDDAEREYAYGPARGLLETKIGRFPPELDAEAQRRGWPVISMKNDWARIFAFET